MSKEEDRIIEILNGHTTNIEEKYFGGNHKAILNNEFIHIAKRLKTIFQQQRRKDLIEFMMDYNNKVLSQKSSEEIVNEYLKP